MPRAPEGGQTLEGNAQPQWARFAKTKNRWSLDHPCLRSLPTTCGPASGWISLTFAGGEDRIHLSSRAVESPAWQPPEAG